MSASHTQFSAPERRVFVTGGSGFLGRRVITQLVGEGYAVAALVRSGSAAATVDALGAHALHGDLDDPASLDDAFAAAESKTLVNVASLGFGHAPAIVAAAEEAGFERGVFVSTTAVATTLNAASKSVRLAAEGTVRASGLAWTIVRPTMIYGGPDDRNMARLLRHLRRAPLLLAPAGGARLQQPVHVEDLAQAIVACLSAPVSIGRTYDIAGPEPLSFAAIVAQAGAALGRRPRIVSAPVAPVARALAVYERFSAHPRLKAEQVLRLNEDKAFDISDARRDLAFEPRSFRSGIEAEALALAGAGGRRAG